MLGRPVHFDFDGPPPDPDWVVHGLIERGTVTVLSADSGAGKSLVCSHMAVAIMQGKPWLGRKTHGERCMFIDEENFLRVVYSRLHAMGMKNADRPKLRYFLRLGVSLGVEDWHERVGEELHDFKPDILVIDTASAATAVDVNDNTGVAHLFASAIRPLADQCAVILLHHERKPQQGTKRHAGHAMMGARQWAGQADAHIALEALSAQATVEAIPGGVRKAFHLNLEMPKNRDGQGVKEKLAIVSEHDDSNHMVSLRVEARR